MIIETIGLTAMVGYSKINNKNKQHGRRKSNKEFFGKRYSDINTSDAVVTKHYIGTFMSKK